MTEGENMVSESHVGSIEGGGVKGRGRREGVSEIEVGWRSRGSGEGKERESRGPRARWEEGGRESELFFHSPLCLTAVLHYRYFSSLVPKLTTQGTYPGLQKSEDMMNEGRERCHNIPKEKILAAFPPSDQTTHSSYTSLHARIVHHHPRPKNQLTSLSNSIRFLISVL